MRNNGEVMEMMSYIHTVFKHSVIRVLMMVCLLVTVVSSSMYAENEDPFSVLEYIEIQMKGAPPANFDSARYAFLKQYIIESDSMGKEEAYTRLSRRVMDYLYNTSSQEKTTDFSSLDELENELNSESQENEHLKRENERLRRKIAQLEKSGKSDSPELTDEQIRKIDSWAKSVVLETNRQADSMTIQNISEGLRPYLPLSLNSLGRSAFVKYFSSDYKAQQNRVNLKDTSTLAAKINDNLNKRFVNDKLNYKTSLSDPNAIGYYNLAEYQPYYVYEAGHDIANVVVMSSDSILPPIKVRTSKKKDDIWQSYGKISLQFMQHYVLNWSKGGNPNATVLGDFKYSINYRKDRTVWENRFTLGVGFMYSENDTIHPFRVYEDETKIKSMFKYQTLKVPKLYYALDFDFITSLFTSYDSYNASQAATSFLSPTRIFFGPGMDYTHNKNIEFFLSPLTMEVNWIIGKKLKPEDFGLKEDKKAKTTFGAKVYSKLSWEFTKDLRLKNDITLYFPYNSPSEIYFNWDISGSFQINRFMSAQLSLKMQYDQHTRSVYRGKMQIKENLSLGFFYSF